MPEINVREKSSQPPPTQKREKKKKTQIPRKRAELKKTLNPSASLRLQGRFWEEKNGTPILRGGKEVDQIRGGGERGNSKEKYVSLLLQQGSPTNTLEGKGALTQWRKKNKGRGKASAELEQDRRDRPISGAVRIGTSKKRPISAGGKKTQDMEGR